MQSKKWSIFESVTNLAVGMIISYLMALTVLPIWFGEVHHSQAAGITAIYTAVSFIRSYGLRRLFNLKARK